MIVVNRMGDVINVSAMNEEFSISYSEMKLAQLLKISEKSQTVADMENFNILLEEVKDICSQAEEEKVQAFHPDIYKDSKTGAYHLKLDEGVISRVPMPSALVRRIEESMDKGLDISPLMKCWMRFLRNKKADSATFANKFFNYIDMKYKHPKIYDEKIAAGYTPDIATEMAMVYQVKITNEGLINCYKVSKEVDWKYKAGEDGEAVKVNLYDRTFDPVTGEVTGDERDDLNAEERIFLPSVMGTSGDEFFCEGSLTNAKGHIIRVGHVHRLESWDLVDCNDNHSCVPGLHVGGLHYIACYSGCIHNVFIDPMHIGAIPDDDTGAMRVIQYFVHSTMVAVNKSIYHSSKYAEKTDEQWQEVKKEILADFGTLKENTDQAQAEIEAL